MCSQGRSSRQAIRSGVLSRVLSLARGTYVSRKAPRVVFGYRERNYSPRTAAAVMFVLPRVVPVEPSTRPRRGVAHICTLHPTHPSFRRDLSPFWPGRVNRLSGGVNRLPGFSLGCSRNLIFGIGLGSFCCTYVTGSMVALRPRALRNINRWSVCTGLPTVSVYGTTRRLQKEATGQLLGNRRGAHAFRVA